MSDELKDLISSQEARLEHGEKIMEKVFSAAQPSAVFGEPVTVGNYTVLTASQVMAGGGFGSGMGFGPEKGRQAKGQETVSPLEPTSPSGGAGAGGGGGSSGRPVAIITIGPDGVTVKPVMDLTKIVIAFFTVWGAMFLGLRRMRKATKG